MWLATLLMACALSLPARADAGARGHDYPTAARADFVIGCLAANGMRRELLDKCACEIDSIAARMDYRDYEQASTILSMQQGGLGPRGALFRDTPQARTVLEELRRAQAEANLACG